MLRQTPFVTPSRRRHTTRAPPLPRPKARVGLAARSEASLLAVHRQPLSSPTTPNLVFAPAPALSMVLPALRAPYDRVAPSPRFASPRVGPFSRHMRRATPSRRAWPPNPPVGRLLSRSRILLVAFFVPSAHPFSLAAVRGKLRPLPWASSSQEPPRPRSASARGAAYDVASLSDLPLLLTCLWLRFPIVSRGAGLAACAPYDV